MVTACAICYGRTRRPDVICTICRPRNLHHWDELNAKNLKKRVRPDWKAGLWSRGVSKWDSTHVRLDLTIQSTYFRAPAGLAHYPGQGRAQKSGMLNRRSNHLQRCEVLTNAHEAVPIVPRIGHMTGIEYGICSCCRETSQHARG